MDNTEKGSSEKFTPILYFGNDDHFFRAIQKGFLAFDNVTKYKFFKKFAPNSHDVKILIKDFISVNPTLVFIDFAIHPDEKLELVKNLVRNNFKKIKPIVVLLNVASDPKLFQSANLTGAQICHVKSIELDDLVYQSFLLINPKAAVPPEVALASDINMDIQLLHPLKIGYVTDSYLHIEHNIAFELGQEIKFSLTSIPGLNMTNFKVLRILDKNYYYPLEHVSDLEYVFDPLVETEQRRIITQFVEKEENTVSSKRTRVLIIDRDLAVLSQAKENLDHYPFALRYYAHPDPDGRIVIRNMAGIIVYVASEQFNAEDEKIVVNLIQKIGLIEGYHPFLFVFRAGLTSEEARTKFSYEKMMCEKGGFEMDTIIKIAENYQVRGGRGITHNQSISFFNKEKRKYFKKSDPRSNAFLNLDVLLTDLSESEIVVKCKVVIPNFTQFVVANIPIEFFVTIFESKQTRDKDGFFRYRGVIHGIDETKKRQLRAYVSHLIVTISQK